MEDSNVRIGLIGKTLVHYKHFKGTTLRAPVSLAAKTTLEEFLIDRGTTLLETDCHGAVIVVVTRGGGLKWNSVADQCPDKVER